MQRVETLRHGTETQREVEQRHRLAKMSNGNVMTCNGKAQKRRALFGKGMEKKGNVKSRNAMRGNGKAPQ